MPDPSRLATPGSPEELLVRRFDLTRLPRHVAIIMDGNGRWAKARSLPRVEGHRAGVQAVKDTVEAAGLLELEALTLYAFSVENWKRPRYEVWTLMNLLKDYIRQELDTLVKNDVHLEVVGRWRELDASVVASLERAIEATAHCRRHAAQHRPQLLRALRDRRRLPRASSPTGRRASGPTSTRRRWAATSTPPACPTPIS